MAFILRAICAAILMTVMVALPRAAEAQPSFSKAFSPTDIGPGATATLNFVITNNSGTPVTDLDFTDALPAGVTLADPADPSTTCLGGTLTAPSGGSTISYTGGSVGGGRVCTVSVLATSSTPGVHMNVSGDLTSSAGNSGPATGNLTVVTTAPGFTKSFSDASIPLGARTTLTHRIDNSANASGLIGLTFSDTLPVGLAVASPANASTTCGGGVLSAAAGTSTISYGPAFSGDATLGAGAICTVSVDVTGGSVGTFNSISGNLTGRNMPSFSLFNSGSAGASLSVTGGDDLQISKAFTDDPVVPGTPVTLEFILQNNNRSFPATGVAFSDDLGAMLAGATFSSALFNDCGGMGGGSSTFSYSGGTIAAGGNCTIRISVSTPAGAAAGSYPNTTSTLSGTIDGSPATGAAASDTLFVTSHPTLTKAFTGAATAGGTAVMQFTITNTSATAPVTDIAFTDDLGAFLSGATINALPAGGFCGAGSTASIAVSTDNQILNITGGNLPAGGSCNFNATVNVPAGTPGGSYTNTTSEMTATISGSPVVSPRGEATLTVNGGINLKVSKAFTTTPVTVDGVTNGTTTLEITIDNTEGAVPVTNLAFTDDLGAMSPVLAGVQATGATANTCSGMATGGFPTANFGYAGGTVAAGATCTIALTVSVPANTATGDYVNTINDLTGLVGATLVSANPTEATLSVLGAADQPPVLTKEFIGGPFLPGELATLRYTITNNNTVSDITGIFFTDSLSTALAGLTVEGALPANPCGAGSTVTGTTFLIFVGGEVLVGAPPCSFDVNVRIPGAAASGSYSNPTSSVTATVGGTVAIGDPALAALVVESAQLAMTKEFTDDPVTVGNAATLEFTITNPTSSTVNSIGFTDYLDGMLSGASFNSALFNDCGGMGGGTTTFGYSGGTLTAGASCTIRISVDIPGGATTGSYPNSVSDLSGDIGGLTVTGNIASDSLSVRAADAPDFSKAFSVGSVTAGETLDLTFTIRNNSTSPISNLQFSDDLGAMLSGVAASGEPVSGCGGTLSGTTVLNFTGGSVAPSSSCDITVTLQIPVDAAAGSYSNATSDLLSNGLVAAVAASDSVTVTTLADLSITLTDSPDPLFPNDTLTYSVVVSNAGPSTATATTGTLPLPAGLTLVSTSGCAEDPAGVPTCTLGDIAPGGSAVYTVAATVDAATSGTLNATAAAASAAIDPNPSNDSASAATTVTPRADISVSKDDGITSVQAGFPTTYAITVANAGPSVDPAVSLSDTLPSVLSCNYTSAASGGASGNTASGSGNLSETLSMPAGSQVVYTAVCVVDVTATGNLVNTATASASISDPDTGNNSATDTNTITDGPVPGFAKAFAPNTVNQGVETVLTFTIDNSVNALAADSLAFTDTFPADMVVASVPGVSNSCGGTFTANAGDASVGLTAGNLAAGATCTIAVNVRATTVGVLTNTTSDLTSTLVTAAPAAADLTVNAANAPGFAKVFAPDVIDQGQVSTLSFTIDNTANAIEATDLAFTDDFPAGLAVASASGVSNGCGGTFTANPGEAGISLAAGTVAAGASCTIDVNVQGLHSGTFDNVTSTLTSSLPTTAAASDTLTVNALPLGIAMSFAPGTIEQFQIATLTYTFANSALIEATSVTLNDTLPASVTIATPGNATTTCSGGVLSAPDGDSALSYTGGSVAAGGSCTISVAVSSGVVGSYANSTETQSSSLGTSAAASATLTVDPATTGTLTIVQNTDTDGSYDFSSAAAELNFTINTAGGTGQQGPITLAAGSYALSQSAPDGVGNTAITCTDDDSAGQPRAGTLTVNLDPLEAVTCTFSSISSRQKTVDTINRFLTKRADLILSSEPGNSRRIDRLKRGAGNASALNFANGDLNSFLPFTAQLSTASDSYQLSSSLLQMRQAQASLAMAHGGPDVMHVPNYRWDAWFEAQYKKFDAGTDSGHFAIAYFGADYLVTPDLLVGALFQVDDMEDDSATLSTSTSGTGWMFGPYLTARLGSNLYFDGRIAAGESSNDISPFNTYVDDFTTARWMAMAGLTGDFQSGNWSIQPNATLSYFEEKQHAYVDGVGVGIPSQTVSLGQIKIGPTFTGQFETLNGMNYSPFFSIDAIYNFGDTSGVTVTNSSSPSTDGWRGRVQAGMDFSLKNGTQISFGGTYDGIGRNSFDVWGLSFELNIPFQKATAN